LNQHFVVVPKLLAMGALWSLLNLVVFRSCSESLRVRIDLRIFHKVGDVLVPDRDQAKEKDTK